MRHRLFPLAELEPGAHRRALVGLTAIVVVRTDSGDLYALRDVCPHQGALLSNGRFEARVVGTEAGRYALEAGRPVMRCPWHGYEFDVATGTCLGDPGRARVKAYAVSVEEGMVTVER